MEKNKYLILKILLLSSLIIIFLPTIFGFIGIPDEDAAIIYNYSKNLAETGTIAFYPGGEPTEGATPFGWMILISIFQVFGIGNHIASGILNSLFLILVFFRYYSIFKGKFRKKLFLLSNFIFFIYGSMAFLSGAFLSGLGGFSTIASCSLLSIIFLSLLSFKVDWLFTSSSILYIFIRPDSIYYYVVICTLFYFSYFILYFQNQKNRTKLSNLSIFFNFLKSTFLKIPNKLFLKFTTPIFCFIVYWIWRFNYFNLLFPLPYYVKERSFSIYNYLVRFFDISFNNSYCKLTYGILLLIYLILEYLKRFKNVDLLYSNNLKNSNLERFNNIENYVFYTRGSFIYYIYIILIFNFFQNIYLARFSLDQNVFNRFHSPSLSIAISLLAYFVMNLNYQKNNFKNLRTYQNEIKSFLLYCFKIKKLIPTIFLIFCLSTLPYMFLNSLYGSYKYVLEPYRSNILSLSKNLNAINNEENISKIIVTEAGRLSYYSGIKTIDAWGLNTKRYSKIPLNAVSRVIEEDPCLINAHMNFSKLPGGLIEAHENKRSWLNMTLALYRGANALNHTLYVVPYYKKNIPMPFKSTLSSRYDLYTVSPKCKASASIKNAIESNGGILIENENQLKKYNNY